MMDKKSANGYPCKTSEAGSQRKQIPYSVETPYGFHLDLDFLKYVDDIEKGNTIKRVHIQRKNRGPKYSTLPRNFSLPGHGARPPPKEVWASGTSTLGPKPKSRVSEVQQIFDFKASDGGSSGLSRVQGSGFSPPPRPADEVKPSVYEEQPLSLQLRPNLFRASSMPVTVPRRKGSDSSEDRSPVAMGESQKESGSLERLFRAADGGDRRGSIPQDRASLHLQITNALKRVRELEEQVKTIPELKSQICSLQEEKVQLLKTIDEQEQREAKQRAREQQQADAEEVEDDEELESPRQGGEDFGLPTTVIYIEPPTPEEETRIDEEDEESVQEQAAEKAPDTPMPSTTISQTCSKPPEGDSNRIPEASGSLPETEMHGKTTKSITEQWESTEQEAETHTALDQQHDRQIVLYRPEESRAEVSTDHHEAENQRETSQAVSEQSVVPKVPLECPVSVVITEAPDESQEADSDEMEGENADLAHHPVDDGQGLIIQTLQTRLQELEAKLSLSSQELEQTHALLREQELENRRKDERIQELSERAKDLYEAAEMNVVKTTVSVESQPQPEPVSTRDASVYTDSVHISVSEKAVCTDEEAQPSNGPKETDLTCSSTQTASVEAKDMEVMAQVVTLEKEVGVEVITCDQAVETEAPVEMALELEERDDAWSGRQEEVAEKENVDSEVADLETTANENVVTEVSVLEEEVFEESDGQNVKVEVKSEETEKIIEERLQREMVVSESVITEGAPVDSAAVECTRREEVALDTAVTKETVASPSSSEPTPKAPRESQPASGPQSQSRRSSSESSGAASPAAIGHVVTRIQGLLNEQWSSLGSATPEASVQSAPKQPTAAKPQQPSKFSSIQSQLVSSLSVLSSFYSPGQKEKAAAAASRQSGLKSIMKKDGTPQKPGNGAAKKNLKFVGVNGGYESTSSEESSGEENQEQEEERKEEEDSSEPEEAKEQEQEQGPQAGMEAQEEADPAGEQGEETGGPDGAMEPRGAETLMSSPEQMVSEVVDKEFMAACYYLKDRRNEVDNPNKEMRQVLMVLYQEWFRVSSQKDSQADTVTLYLREVGNATPTLLSYIVNLADGNGNTALHYSVSHSNFPVVKLLLDTELCEVDHQNKAGYTAIMLAALTAAESSEDAEVAQQLLKKGNINAHASQTGQTALMLAVSHGRTGMVRVLLNCGADVNVQDHDGSTALMCASEHGHIEIARVLLEHPDCDTSLKDKYGHTALSVATQASHTEVVDLLKEHSGRGTMEEASAPH